MPAEIFNDQKFASPEAQREFHERAAHLDPVYVDKLLSVMGRPSQFVGRVNSFDSAVEHWRQWDIYDATEGKAWRERKKPKDTEVEETVEKRPPGRPPTRPAIERDALKKWREATMKHRDAKLSIDLWEETEINKIRAQAGKFRKQWHEYVSHYKEEYEKAKTK